MRTEQATVMANGRSNEISRLGRKPARKTVVGTGSARDNRQAAYTVARQRTVVLDGTFSIKEMEVKGTSRRKAKKPMQEKVSKEAAHTTKKKMAGKKAGKASKRVTKPSSVKNPAGAVKPAEKKKVRKNPAVVEPGPVVLPRHPSIKNVAELKEQLLEVHGTAATVVVDAREVESIDTAALQLLVAFMNSLREQSGSVEWDEPSAVFSEMAELADLSRALGIGDDAAIDVDDDLCPVF